MEGETPAEIPVETHAEAVVTHIPGATGPVRFPEAVRQTVPEREETSFGKAAGWKFIITEGEAEKQVRSLLNRRATQDAVIDYVMDNLDNRYATPATAPSNYGWNRLVQATRNPVQAAKFHALVEKRESERQKKAEVEKAREDDMRVQFKLFDAVERELARQKEAVT
jgi:hypothetical protein